VVLVVLQVLLVLLVLQVLVPAGAASLRLAAVAQREGR
jgi:hypothetical protein